MKQTTSGIDDHQAACYTRGMPKKPLIKTNPYLKDPSLRRRLLRTTVLSSTAIEGVGRTLKGLHFTDTVPKRAPARGSSRSAESRT